MAGEPLYGPNAPVSGVLGNGARVFDGRRASGPPFIQLPFSQEDAGCLCHFARKEYSYKVLRDMTCLDLS